MSMLMKCLILLFIIGSVYPVLFVIKNETDHRLNVQISNCLHYPTKSQNLEVFGLESLHEVEFTGLPICIRTGYNFLATLTNLSGNEPVLEQATLHIETLDWTKSTVVIISILHGPHGQLHIDHLIEHHAQGLTWNTKVDYL